MKTLPWVGGWAAAAARPDRVDPNHTHKKRCSHNFPCHVQKRAGGILYSAGETISSSWTTEPNLIQSDIYSPIVVGSSYVLEGLEHECISFFTSMIYSNWYSCAWLLNERGCFFEAYCWTGMLRLRYRHQHNLHRRVFFLFPFSTGIRSSFVTAG